MEDYSTSRKLNSRERRRLKVHNMLPVDALSSPCSLRTSEIFDFYRYGCGIEDARTKIEIKKGCKKCLSFCFHS